MFIHTTKSDRQSHTNPGGTGCLQCGVPNMQYLAWKSLALGGNRLTRREAKALVIK